MNTYIRHRCLPDIIIHTVWLYYRFNFSHCDSEDLLAERGITVSYAAIRLWRIKSGAIYTRGLKRKYRGFGDTSYINEVVVKINGNSITCGGLEIRMVKWLMYFSRPKEMALGSNDSLNACSGHRAQSARATSDMSRRSYKTKGMTNGAFRATQLKKLGQLRRQFRHAVFEREPQACYDCGSDTIKGSVASRRLYWCPACQFETSERL